MRPILLRLSIALAGFAALAAPALAERADREKPVNIEADKMSVDDKNKVAVFEGRVTLAQGSLMLRADKVVVSQDLDGFQKGVATGGPGGLARFRQKRDGREEWVEGEAERIEHDARSEQTKFFNRAWVKNGQDEVRGEYIFVDNLSQSYTVTSGPEGTVTKSTPGRDTRVRAVIVPKSKTPAPAADIQAPAPPPASSPLRASPAINNPRQERQEEKP
jgi:lipopolysaccharide export system protein LptA